jgi:hypothetical protein
LGRAGLALGVFLCAAETRVAFLMCQSRRSAAPRWDIRLLRPSFIPTGQGAKAHRSPNVAAQLGTPKKPAENGGFFAS